MQSKYSICICILKILNNKEQIKNLTITKLHAKKQFIQYKKQHYHDLLELHFKSLSNPSFPEKPPTPQERWNAASAIFMRSHSQSQLKTDKYFPTVGCPLLHMLPTKPALQLYWLLLLATVQKQGKQSIRMAYTEGCCTQEYLWNYSSSQQKLKLSLTADRVHHWLIRHTYFEV